MFTTPFPNAFGLDIGDLSIKVAQLRNVSHRYYYPSYDLVACRCTTLPYGLITNGQIGQPEKVRKYISHLLTGRKNKDKPIRSPWVIASLPETQGFIKLIQIDKEPDDIIADDIVYAAKKHTPFNEEEYYIDWQIIADQSKKEITNVLIATIPKQTANLYTYLLESLGLGVIALEIEPLAIARAMITASKDYKNEARAILDLGATRSSLIIYDHDIIQFNTSIPYSGELLTTAISQKMHVTYEEAEKIKIQQGLNYEKGRGETWHIISNLTDNLAKHIQKAFKFYYSHFPDANRINHITMCGGGSIMNRLDKVLSLKLKISARPGKPWKNLSSRKKISINEKESLKYTTAIGLALRAADNPFFKHDII